MAHAHTAATFLDTHNSIRDGFDRVIEKCACGATRSLTRELGENVPTYSGWAHSEATKMHSRRDPAQPAH
jgi:hypothetical protein